MSKKVFIIGGNPGYVRMFESMGWEVTRDFTKKVDLFQFTGGADVSPELYGRKPMVQTHSDKARDRKERQIFEKIIGWNKPMAGICRGSQFLCAMSGHELYQHVENHAIHGTHQAIELSSGDTYQVTSTHHQMMKIDPDRTDVDVLVVAHEDGRKWYKDEEGNSVEEERNLDDVESAFFHNTQALSFQPHPEFIGAEETKALYFKLLKETLGL